MDALGRIPAQPQDAFNDFACVVAVSCDAPRV
jgi:hypothetical protein